MIMSIVLGVLDVPEILVVHYLLLMKRIPEWQGSYMTFWMRMIRKSLFGLVKCVPTLIVVLEDAVVDVVFITMVHETFVWRGVLEAETIEAGVLNIVESVTVPLELDVEPVEILMEDIHLVI